MTKFWDRICWVIMGLGLVFAGYLVADALTYRHPPPMPKHLNMDGTPREIARISTNGVVYIDWRAVETEAANCHVQVSEDICPTWSAFARVMLSIRDKTWEPMVR